MGIGASAGGLHSTAADMMKYMKSYLKEQPTSYPFKKAYTKLYKIDNSTQVGYAWNRVGTGTPYAILHNGETNGQRAFIGFFEGSNTGVFILSNQAEGDDSDVLDLAAINILVELQKL